MTTFEIIAALLVGALPLVVIVIGTFCNLVTENHDMTDCGIANTVIDFDDIRYHGK